MAHAFYIAKGKNGKELVGKEYKEFAREMSRIFNITPGVKETCVNRETARIHYEFESGEKIQMPNYFGPHQEIQDNRFYVEGKNENMIEKRISLVKKLFDECSTENYQFEEVKLE